MMSKIPLKLETLNKAVLDREILRAAIIAELDAINLYEQMAGLSEDQEIRKILMDVAREEKTHVGEFQALLLQRDTEQSRELQAGEKEVSEKSAA